MKSTPVTLTLTGDQHPRLKHHLFPGDGKEAVAILLCNRRAGDRRHRLLATELHPISYGACTERRPDRVTWSPDSIEDILEHAAAKKLSVIKLHSHPNGYARFSSTDDNGDERLLPMIAGWVEADVPHGSAVMLPSGEIFGRVVGSDGVFVPISAINVVGDDLQFWYPDSGAGDVPSFAASHAQAFDEGTIERLRRLSIAVVGCSGTGSPVVEQLLRLGVGELVIVDGDHMKDRNVNRILNSTMQDARERRAKVDVQAASITRTGLGTRVIALTRDLWDPEVIKIVAECDIVFGCMDTVDGRFLLNTLATYYSQAYFDLGIRLVAVRDGADKGQIQEICGSVHYLQPGRSSLMSRGLVSMAAVAAAGLARNDPAAHAQQVDDGYIRGVAGRRPAVISVNMFAAALAVNELLARIHPFREEPNRAYASTTFSLSSMELISDPEEGDCAILARAVGKGDTVPLLGLMELAELRP